MRAAARPESPGRRWLDHRAQSLVPLLGWAAASGVVRFADTAPFAAVGLGLAAVAAGATAALVGRVSERLSAAQVAGVVVLALWSVAVIGSASVQLVAMGVATVVTGWAARRFTDLALGVIAAVLGVLAVAWTMVLLLAGLFDERPWTDLVAGGVIVALLAAGAAAADRAGRLDVSRPATASAWVGALLLVGAVFVHGPQGQVVVSLLWAVAAIGALLVGVTLDRRLFRILGLATLALLLIKLLTVDLAAVDALWRVGLFLMIGAGLMRLGYVLPRLAAAVEPQRDREEPTPLP